MLRLVNRLAAVEGPAWTQGCAGNGWLYNGPARKPATIRALTALLGSGGADVAGAAARARNALSLVAPEAAATLLAVCALTRQAGTIGCTGGSWDAGLACNGAKLALSPAVASRVTPWLTALARLATIARLAYTLSLIS